MATKGLIEREWESFLAILPKDAHPIQISECRRAFYAGAQALFAGIITGLSPGTEPTEADGRLMEGIKPRDLPILMSGQMVRAALEDRKSVTRRLNGLADVNEHPEWWRSNPTIGPLGYMAKKSAQGKFGATFFADRPGEILVCPQIAPYAPGDRLWVRETFGILDHWRGNPPIIEKVSPGGDTHALVYCADCPDFEWTDGDGSIEYRKDGRPKSDWTPPIHMPRWASRLTLEVLSVRAERLQEITEEDAILEGFQPVKKQIWWQGYQDNDGRLTHLDVPGDEPPAWMIELDDLLYPSALRQFEQLWDRLNGKRSPWERNDWIWRYEFKRLEASRG